MNPDTVEIYKRKDGRWEWRRKNGRNGNVTSTSGNQGYENKLDCLEMARKMNSELGLAAFTEGPEETAESAGE